MKKSSLLCVLGIHKRDPYKYVIERRQSGRHKWHVNYSICQRCGKALNRISFRKEVKP